MIVVEKDGVQTCQDKEHREHISIKEEQFFKIEGQGTKFVEKVEGGHNNV